MPKDRNTSSASTGMRSRASPYPCSSSRHCRDGSSSSPHKPPAAAAAAAAAKDLKEWDEVRCPVCMEHPHNAVLLVCTSSTKGCRPFMCDTSYRHSNCLDQYRKASSGTALSHVNEAEQKLPELSCPLCRGAVIGWTVVESARRYMNSKPRSCSMELCGFNGVYEDIRKHARLEHPSARPTETDPDREREWRRMEQQRDIGDLLSTIQSAIGGGEEDEDPVNVPIRSTTTILFILRFRGPGSTGIGMTSTRSGSGRATVLWEETVSGPEPAVIINSGSDDDDDNGVVDSGVIDEMSTPSSRHPSSSDDEDDDPGI